MVIPSGSTTAMCRAERSGVEGLKNNVGFASRLEQLSRAGQAVSL